MCLWFREVNGSSFTNFSQFVARKDREVVQSCVKRSASANVITFMPDDSWHELLELVLVLLIVAIVGIVLAWSSFG